MPSERTLALTDPEAALMARGELRALVRPRWNDLHKCPFGAPGQRIGLKETWSVLPWVDDEGETIRVIYKANHQTLHGDIFEGWHSPITMPSWAIRHYSTAKTVRAMLAKDLNIAGTVWDKQPYANEGHHMAAMTEMYKQVGGENVWVWFCELEASNGI